MNEKWEDTPMAEQLATEYREAIDVFPALHKYKNDHTVLNLKKLCVEVVGFCRSIYASTRTPEERTVYFDVFDKIKKK